MSVEEQKESKTLDIAFYTFTCGQELCLAILSPHQPLRIGALLFPHFQALDIFGPLDALNLLSESHPLTLSLIAPTLTPMRTSSGPFTQEILPTHTFTTAPPLDVLLVPGGPGTRDPENMAPCIDFVKKVYPSLKYLITICTGAVITAEAGICDGKRGTTNKRAWDFVTAKGKNVRWVEKARWCVDGKWWSGSGVSAGIDVAFAWMGHVWGEEVQRDVARKMEYVLRMDPDDDPFAEVYGLGGGGKGRG